MTGKQYNYCIDFIKGIACIFVVFMHCEFPGLFGTAIQAISRFSVPFFFMVSGYFCYRPIANHTELAKGEYSCTKKKKLIHIAKITLYASLLYIAVTFLYQVFFHINYFHITGSQLINWAVFNAPPRMIAGQYWFLFALLYTYAFYYLLERSTSRKFEYILGFILILSYFILAQGAYIFGFNLPNMLYRNWLIEAFPFFMLGHWLHENQVRINVSNSTLISVIVISSLLCLAERWLIGRDFGVNLVTIPQVFALFVYGVKNPTRHEGFIQRIGRDCSMLVYILHPIVWNAIDAGYDIARISHNLPALYAKPIFVVLVSIILAFLFNALVEIIKKKNNRITNATT